MGCFGVRWWCDVAGPRRSLLYRDTPVTEHAEGAHHHHHHRDDQRLLTPRASGPASSSATTPSTTTLHAVVTHEDVVSTRCNRHGFCFFVFYSAILSNFLRVRVALFRTYACVVILYNMCVDALLTSLGGCRILVVSNGVDRRSTMLLLYDRFVAEKLRCIVF